MVDKFGFVLVEPIGDGSLKPAHIIAEGGIWEVGQLKNVLDTGVYAVVIGSAITRPMDITKHFMKAFGE